VVVKQVDTNAVGDVRVIQAALPLDHESENPVVVNTSSGLGSFWAVTNPEHHESHKSFVVYRAAKAAVSMLTVRRARLHLDRSHRQRCGSYGRGGRRGHRAPGNHRQGRLHRHLPENAGALTV